MSTDLALTRPEPMMDRQSLELMLDQAERYVASGLLPASIKTPQQALIIMAAGRELGIPATAALRGIVVVQGKPTCSAELMMALVHRTYGQGAMRVARTDNESCTVQYRQQGWDGVSEYTFSMEDARRANLLKNPTWNQYPAAMLRARAISATVRFAFPEVISGVYLPEEIGAEVEIVDGAAVPIQAGATPKSEPDGPAPWIATFEDQWAKGVALAHETGTVMVVKPEISEGKAACDEALRTLAARVRARRTLLDTLVEVVGLAKEAGAQMDVPENYRELDSADIQAMIASAQAVIPATEAA